VAGFVIGDLAARSARVGRAQPDGFLEGFEVGFDPAQLETIRPAHMRHEERTPTYISAEFTGDRELELVVRRSGR